MDQPNPTFAKFSILDTGKFKQQKFRIQHYLQNEHYALWEVIEFGDSYKAPPKESGKGPASESSAKKKGRTVVITTEDMQKRRNDVKARTTLLLALPDEHQLRFSKFTWTFFLRTKDETSSILRNFITEIKNLKDLKVKITRCDNGGEFKNKEMNEFCTKKGIIREFSNARTPQQNGVAEKRNKTLIKAARTMLADVVIAGTSSTNISGTKDVASQAVKKYVSSLRYIALPNWFHEAHIESSNSDAQDDCNVDVPENSGISNPTATLKVPTADQMETLTVESEIPTVSSSVPIVFLNISPESSSVDSNEVEADLSNMESSIPASPTPTFRIHKDHPKSQIIGPVDTPVQTRHKSKKIEEQSFIATIHHKKNPDLLQFCLFSCFLSQKEPKKIFDALKDLSWMDVKSAFLYGTIDEEVYVMQPLRFQDPEFLDIVYKVEKAMYGLHQAPRAWYGTLSKYLLDNGFQRDVRSANTPMDKENPWGKDGPGKDVELHLYRSMIGSLMYLTASRPDITIVVLIMVVLHKIKKSTTGGCQILGRRLISWQCKKQTIMATSITEAEYMAAASGCGQVLWIQNHMLDYGEQRTHEFMHVYLVFASVYVWIGNFIMAKLAFCDYHNMIAILEKTEYNIDFHQIVDFLEAFHISPKSTGFNEFRSNIATVVGEGSAILTEPHHTPSPQEQHSPHLDPLSPSYPTTTTEPIPQTSIATPTLRQYSRRATRIAQSKALSPAADEPASLFGDDRHEEAFPTVFSLDARQDREKINKTSALPHESSPRKCRAYSKDAPIKGGIMETGEEVRAEKSTELGSNDTEEMVNVLSSMEAANILTSKVAAVSVSPIAGVLAAAVSAAGVPTVSGSFPTFNVIFTTVSVVTSYTRRPRGITIGGTQQMRSLIIGAKDKGKQKVVELAIPKKRKFQEQIDAQVAKEMEEEFARENQMLNEQLARDSEIARLYPEEELKMMIEGLDRSNKVIAKHLQEYEQAEAELTVREKIELINELTKHFKGMTLEEIKEKFIPVWKQFEDFVPMSSKEEAKRVKRKGLKLDQGSSKRMKTFEDVSKEDLKGLMQIVPLEEVYVEGLQRRFTSAVDLEFEDQLWTHNQAFMHDHLDWKLYDTCGVHHVSTKDHEIFMLVERDYPLRRGLATVMICNKLQVEQYSQMANDLILKIHNIVNCPR
nr:ribonuclease H-like domain-containing protein [Tanacetum cinerariifolium]